MRIMGSIFHGMLDYLVGLFLIVAPWVLNFTNDGPETWVPIILGSVIVVYSLMTRYELGIFKVFPFKMHLILDLASGILLAVSPWLFGFADFIYLSHLVLGLMLVVVGLMTHTHLEDPTKADKFTHLHPSAHH